MNFVIESKNYQITPAQIVQAMAAFDNGDCPPRDKNWLTNTQYTRAVERQGRFYPPKFLIRHAIRQPDLDFNTSVAEYILKQLGFSVAAKPNPSVSPTVEESSRTPTSNPELGKNGQNQGSERLDRVQKILEIVVKVLAVVTGAVTAISGILALLKSK